jgi:hypothetical protein
MQPRRWVGLGFNATPSPLHPWESNPVPFVQEDDRAQDAENITHRNSMPAPFSPYHLSYEVNTEYHELQQSVATD